MVWIDFDWLKYEAEQFQGSLNHRIREAHRAAYAVLRKAHEEATEELQAELNSATDDESRELTSQVIDYEELRWIWQTEALAAMALTLLASRTESFLNEHWHRFDKTHPPDSERSKRGSKLLKMVRKYRTRFNVDLETICGFETVREVVLARNCCVHNGNSPDKDYKTQSTTKRLLSTTGNINLTPEDLDIIIGELSE